MKSCEEIQALIEGYLDGELTREQKHLFETHISSCNDCHEALLLAENIRQTLHTMPEIDVPEDFNSALKHRISKECKAQRNSFVFYAKRYGALAACVILAVVIGGRLSNFDFTQKAENFDVLSTDEAHVPELRSGNIEQDAGETITPTKEKETTQPSPMPDAAINASASSKNVAADESAAEITDMAKEENLTSSSTEEKAVGAGMPKKAATVHTEPDVTLTVQSEHKDAVLSLVNEIATEDNGIYSAAKTGFDNLINAFDIIGIPYTLDGTADGEVVTFVVQ